VPWGFIWETANPSCSATRSGESINWLTNVSSTATRASRRANDFRDRRWPLASVAPHQPRHTRDAPDAMERGGVVCGQSRVQARGRAARRDPARGVVQLSNPTVEAALRAHIHAVGELLIRERGSHVDTVEDDSYDRWGRESDGTFRPTRIRVPVLFSEWSHYQDRSHSLPTFAALAEAISADHVLSPQFPAAISAAGASQTLDVDKLVREMKSALIDTGRDLLEFSEERFNRQWEAIARDLYADSLNCVTVVLLPGLTVPGELPVEVAPGLEIVALSDAEVTRAVGCNLLYPVHVPFIRDIEARAIRHIHRVPKRIVATPDLRDLSIAEGDFGQRPPLMFHLFADDVLCALRLAKAGSLTSPGAMRYVDSWLVQESTQFHARPGRPSIFGPGLLPLDARSHFKTWD